MLPIACGPLIKVRGATGAKSASAEPKSASAEQRLSVASATTANASSRSFNQFRRTAIRYDKLARASWLSSSAPPGETRSAH
jgi:hypothetical protein